jgi:hypothetical protein
MDILIYQIGSIDPWATNTIHIDNRWKFCHIYSTFCQLPCLHVISFAETSYIIVFYHQFCQQGILLDPIAYIDPQATYTIHIDHPQKMNLFLTTFWRLSCLHVITCACKDYIVVFFCQWRLIGHIAWPHWINGPLIHIYHPFWLSVKIIFSPHYASCHVYMLFRVQMQATPSSSITSSVNKDILLDPIAYIDP